MISESTSVSARYRHQLQNMTIYISLEIC